MRGIKLSKENYEILNNFLKTATSIKTLYDKLYELEVDGKKDTNNYKKLVDYLKIAIDVENNEYSKIFLSCDEAIDIINYITLTRGIDEDENCFDTIVNFNEKDIIYKRVMSLLYDRYIFDSPDNCCENPIEELIESLEINGLEEALEKSSYTSEMLSKSIDNNLYDGFLVFLNKIINSNEFDKKLYYKSKYNLCFLNHYIEEGLIDNDFDIPNIIMQENINKNADDVLYNTLKERLAFDFSISQIGNLLKKEDINYMDKKEKASSILRQCFIRSAFLLMSDDAIINIKEAYHDFMNDEEHLSFKDGRYISRQMINNCFITYKTDKKASRLSLK